MRNLADSKRANVVAVGDFRAHRRAAAERRFPGVHTTDNMDDIFTRADIDAVAIATPVSSHFELASSALAAGKHVLVEKPMTQTVAEAKQLVEAAERAGCVLMVDHTFVYTGAVKKIRELISTGELGELYYYDSSRVNLGLFQHDVDVLWDLAVHDFAILDYLLDEQPESVSAHGIAHIDGSPENLAYVTLFFASGPVAHVNVNWLAPAKLRRTLIGGSKRMVVYDDLEPDEKVKVYDKGVTITDDPGEIYRMRIGYRVGDMWCPQLERTEALRSEIEDFINCIENKSKSVIDGRAGLRVMQILEAATVSMGERGRRVDLESPL